MHPEISVIVPALNEERYLERTLASIANQNTNTPYELIVADSESTDESVSIAERYADGMGLLGTLYYYTQLDLGRAIDGSMIDKMSKKLGIADLRDYVGIR